MLKDTNSIGFSMVAVAAGILLFVSGPLVVSMQALAFPWFGFGGFHRGFGLHHFAFPFGFGLHYFGRY
ncbi:MAG: hypothetical protein WBF33_22035 [Candidatus Nitrosopolaris sp.]